MGKSQKQPPPASVAISGWLGLTAGCFEARSEALSGPGDKPARSAAVVKDALCRPVAVAGMIARTDGLEVKKRCWRQAHRESSLRHSRVVRHARLSIKKY